MVGLLKSVAGDGDSPDYELPRLTLSAKQLGQNFVIAQLAYAIGLVHFFDGGKASLAVSAGLALSASSAENCNLVAKVKVGGNLLFDGLHFVSPQLMPPSTNCPNTCKAPFSIILHFADFSIL
jgi:hypothetical protein